MFTPDWGSQRVNIRPDSFQPSNKSPAGLEPTFVPFSPSLMSTTLPHAGARLEFQVILPASRRSCCHLIGSFDIKLDKIELMWSSSVMNQIVITNKTRWEFFFVCIERKILDRTQQNKHQKGNSLSSVCRHRGYTVWFSTSGLQLF